MCSKGWNNRSHTGKIEDKWLENIFKYKLIRKYININLLNFIKYINYQTRLMKNRQHAIYKTIPMYNISIQKTEHKDVEKYLSCKH